ncbi:MAG: MAPEG family protein [Gammaproteobacteria bacterium]
MNAPAILGPAATLVLWSMIILTWMVITRFKAFSAAGVTLSSAPIGSRYADVERDMPEKVNWVSHNYSHLMEQPTIFYAVVVILAIAGGSNDTNVGLAWAYVGLRVAHSLWQVLVNAIPVRVTLFALSTFCLLALAVNAVRLTVL